MKQRRKRVRSGGFGGPEKALKKNKQYTLTVDGKKELVSEDAFREAYATRTKEGRREREEQERANESVPESAEKQSAEGVSEGEGRGFEQHLENVRQQIGKAMEFLQSSLAGRQKDVEGVEHSDERLDEEEGEEGVDVVQNEQSRRKEITDKTIAILERAIKILQKEGQHSSEDVERLAESDLRAEEEKKIVDVVQVSTNPDDFVDLLQPGRFRFFAPGDIVGKIADVTERAVNATNNPRLWDRFEDMMSDVFSSENAPVPDAEVARVLVSRGAERVVFRNLDIFSDIPVEVLKDMREKLSEENIEAGSVLRPREIKRLEKQIKKFVKRGVVPEEGSDSPTDRYVYASVLWRTISKMLTRTEKNRDKQKGQEGDLESQTDAADAVTEVEEVMRNEELEVLIRLAQQLRDGGIGLRGKISGLSKRIQRMSKRLTGFVAQKDG